MGRHRYQEVKILLAGGQLEDVVFGIHRDAVLHEALRWPGTSVVLGDDGFVVLVQPAKSMEYVGMPTAIIFRTMQAASSGESSLVMVW